MNRRGRRARWGRAGRLAAVLALVLCGSALRVHDIAGKGLWSDELFSAKLALYHPILVDGPSSAFRRTHLHGIEDGDSFWTAKAADQSPPLFELIVKPFVGLLGVSELAVRGPSLLAGIGLLVLVGARCIRSRRGRESLSLFVLLLLIAFSSALIEYSQEARAYSLGVLLSAALVFRFHDKATSGTDTPSLPGWPEIGIFALALWTHYDLLALCAPLLAYYFWAAARARDWSAIGRLGAPAAGFGLWLALAAHSIRSTADGKMGWAGRFNLGEALYRSLSAVLDLVGAEIVAVSAALAIFLAISGLVYPRIRLSVRRDGFGPLLLLGAAYLLLVSFIASRSGIFHPRHLLFGLPILFLLVARLIPRFAVSRIPALCIAGVLIASQLPAMARYGRRDKEEYRKAAAWVHSRSLPGSVVFTTWQPNRDFYRFYLEQESPHLRQQGISTLADARVACADLSTGTGAAILAHESHGDLVTALVESCGDRYRRVEWRFPGLIAQVWRPQRLLPPP